MKVHIKFITKLYQFILINVFCLISYTVNTQELSFTPPDSLKSLSFESLYNDYIKTYEDTLISKLYLNTYLYKATHEDNLQKKAVALHYLSYYEKEFKDKIMLIDSSITISKNLKSINYPLLSYSFKAGYYYNEGLIDKALNTFLLMFEESKKRKNDYYINMAQHNIASIKGDLGLYKESLETYKKSYIYEKRFSEKDVSYLETIRDLTYAYVRNKKLDSALLFVIKGKQKTKSEKLYYLNRHFVLLEGIIDHENNDFNNAIKNFNRVYNDIISQTDEAIFYKVMLFYYMGKCQMQKNNLEKAKDNFVKMDSVIQTKPLILPIIKDGYSNLISLNKQSNDKADLLKQINRFIAYDSIENHYKTKLGIKLKNDFDIPNLIQEKQHLLESLNSKHKKANIYIYFLLTLLFATTILIVIQYRKRKSLRKKYKEVVQKISKTEKEIKSFKKESSIPKKINLSQKILKDLTEKLELFESEQRFLQKDLNRVTMAKMLATNTKYLSTVIKHKKGESFTDYINKLRINCALKELKENHKIRQYTIQAIAEGFGFNNAESFANSFKKYTGLKPSYFIKQIQKDGL